MGQQEVLNFLVKQRVNNAQWFCIKEIREGLEALGLSNGSLKGLSDDLYKLSVYNLIDAKGQGLFDHKKVFRAKKKNIT